MWGNITGVVGAALQKVQTLQNELESQMDSAVGAESKPSSSASDSNLNAISSALTEPSESIADLQSSSSLPHSKSLDSVISDGSTVHLSVKVSDDAVLIDTLSAALEKSKCDLSKAVQRIKSLTASDGSLKLQLEKAVYDYEALRNETEKNQVELVDKQSKIDSLAAEISLLQKDIKSLQEYNEKIQTVSSNDDQLSKPDNEELLTELNSLRKDILMKEHNLNSVSSRVDFLEKNEVVHAKHTAELKEKLQLQLDEIGKLNHTLSSKIVENEDLLADCVRLKEVVNVRESSLETANKQLRDLNKSHQDMSALLNDLRSEISLKDSALKKQQSTSADEADTSKQLSKCLEQLKEKELRLAAFEHEGQSLAKKHSDMEQIVRKSKTELKEKTVEIGKLKESKEQLVKAIEEMQEVIKKHETDVNNSSKNLSAMQAVSNASTEKLTRLEAEISAKVEELASQRRALENAWNDNNEAKRAIAELKADRDDLRRQIGEGTSKVMETESYRRDIEQREAVLRATSKQLQDSLQRQMQESSTREERLREEVIEMRKRWQDAVASREAIASDLGSSTAPLLRQISSLQDSLRQKGESWQNVEISLSERALRAENKAEILDHKKSMLEEQLDSFKTQLSSVSSRLLEVQSQLQASESVCDRLRRAEALWNEEKVELDAKISSESIQRQNQFNSLRELEIRHKMEVKDLNESLNLQLAQKDLEISKLKRDLDQLTNELNILRSSGLKSPVSSSELVRSYGSPMETVKASTSVSEVLSNGDLSFAGNERMQQRRHQQNEEILILQNQMQQLQNSRNALLEEVSFLSNRNSQLEESCVALPGLIVDLNVKEQRIDLLLTMLGEKEEELEAIMSDLKEVKGMYKSHMEELLERVVNPNQS